ncbi:hypothetical protein UFOVP134_38 [uncultured Caudovirales phage]|uniref:Uncharacterized protein n=1 Tax=uncultured Caudovirales phage TaxID=2100421 RepID=A0A6J5LKI6_9CAUD|nr:hypothetical protein UFOVP134_38 [uncultured Caudovirales phage]
MLHLKMTETYQATPRNAAYLMERACVAAHDAETFQSGLARLRHYDAVGLLALIKRLFNHA